MNDELRKGFLLKPYPQIQTQNLKLLLLLARITVYLGCFVLLIAMLSIVFAFFATGIAKFLPVLTYAPLAVSILFFSGLMAAIVSFEENYRIRTELLIQSNNI